ncbi:unnamed protein product [Rotaria sordida]|uniref:Uncharacterized protein n=1 Tax=Rotaria sordida TaxID=392033 RepID=A0A814BI64_9BILA|nr:unnamed protein product [Rotaria sordida]
MEVETNESATLVTDALPSINRINDEYDTDELNESTTTSTSTADNGTISNYNEPSEIPTTARNQVSTFEVCHQTTNNDDRNETATNDIHHQTTTYHGHNENTTFDVSAITTTDQLKEFFLFTIQQSLDVKTCESNLKDITIWLVTVYSLGYTVSKVGVNFLKLSEAIQASSTLKTWSELIGQLPSLGNALATGAKTAGTISGKILGVSVIISVADLIQTWISKNATLTSIDKDISLLEQQLIELKRIADVYHA